jgi:hypothetical protein|nr:MAG TPA: hypothetical protein [Caudoviricetes sp.]
MADCKKIGGALIVSVGDEELHDYDLEELQKDAPLGVAVVNVIYWYKKFGYEGGGTIVYRDSCDKWHIDDLTHCSCYGPCHYGFSEISYSLSDIRKLLKKEDYYENGGKEILNYLENERLVEDDNE